MSSYDREEKRPDRPPAWRSSEGRMWEASPTPKKEGRDHLTGYEPHPSEGSARPREAARMSGSYGDVAVGVSRKKELTLVVSKRRSREGPAATGDEKTLKGGGARRMNLARGDFRVNAHDKKKSAVAYRESHKKPPYFLLERFREMMRTRDQDTLAGQVPFLDRRPEREALRRLQTEAETLRARGGAGSRYALREIESRKQAQRQSLTEKKTQERRLRLLLLKAQEESRRRAGETERAQPLWSAGPEEPETPPEGGPPKDGGDPGKDGDGEAERLADELLRDALDGREPPEEAAPEEK